MKIGHILNPYYWIKGVVRRNPKPAMVSKDFEAEFNLFKAEIEKRLDDISIDISTVCQARGRSAGVNISKLMKKEKLPELEKKWAASEAKKAEEVNRILKTKGGRLVKLQKRLGNLILENERKGMNTEGLKNQLSMLDRIIKGDI